MKKILLVLAIALSLNINAQKFTHITDDGSTISIVQQSTTWIVDKDCFNMVANNGIVTVNNKISIFPTDVYGQSFTTTTQVISFLQAMLPDTNSVVFYGVKSPLFVNHDTLQISQIGGGAYIPLAGTTDTSQVTGNIYFQDKVKLVTVSPGLDSAFINFTNPPVPHGKPHAVSLNAVSNVGGSYVGAISGLFTPSTGGNPATLISPSFSLSAFGKTGNGSILHADTLNCLFSSTQPTFVGVGLDTITASYLEHNLSGARNSFLPKFITDSLYAPKSIITQTITLTGGVVGTGTGSIATTLQGGITINNSTQTFSSNPSYSIPTFTMTPLKTSTYTLSVGDFATFSITANTNCYLPNAPTISATGNPICAVKLISFTSTNSLTINCQGSDVFNSSGGATSTTLILSGQAKTFIYKSGIWTIQGDDSPLGQLDLRYAPSNATFTVNSVPMALGTSSTTIAAGTGISIGSSSVITADVQLTNTVTLTNKRITKRVGTVTTATAVTINTDNVDIYTVTSLTTATTFSTTGTPVTGDKLILRIYGASSQTLSFNTNFNFSSYLTAPTATTAGKYFYMEFIWNEQNSKWDNTYQKDGY